jgi:hypothetical protein
MNGTGEGDKTIAVLSLFIIMIHEKSIIVELRWEWTFTMNVRWPMGG